MAAFEESLALVSPSRSAAPEQVQQQAQPLDLAALVTAHSALLYRVAYSVLRSRAEAEDVVQDSFVRVLEHSKAAATVREPRVWLVRIAWNLALDRLRRRRTRPGDAEFIESLVAPETPADRALEQSRQMQAVLGEIERLPAQEREALLLSSIQELSTAEIATIVGRSEAAVRGLLFRARQRLRERLEKAGYR